MINYNNNSQDNPEYTSMESEPGSKKYSLNYTCFIAVVLLIMAKIVFKIIDTQLDSTNGILSVISYLLSLLTGIFSCIYLASALIETISISKKNNENSKIALAMILLSIISSVIVVKILLIEEYGASVGEYITYIFVVCVISASLVAILNKIFTHGKFEAVIIGVLVYIVLNNYTSIVDFPRFVTNNAVKYSGYCMLDMDSEMYYERGTKMVAGNFISRWKFGLILDTGETLSMPYLSPFKEKTNSKFTANGAYRVVYLPASKHILSLSKIDDKMLLDSKNAVTTIAAPVSMDGVTFKSLVTYGTKEYRANCSIKVTEVVNGPKILDFKTIIPVPSGTAEEGTVALKLVMDIENFSSNDEDVNFGDFIDHFTVSIVDKSSEFLAGCVYERFSGSFEREVYSKENIKILPESKISVSGWILVTKYSDSDDIVLLKVSQFHNGKDDVTGKLDVTEYLK